MKTPSQKRKTLSGFLFDLAFIPALILICAIAGAVGYVAIHFTLWPLVGAYFLGVRITDTVFFGLFFAPFVLLILVGIFFRDQGDRFFNFIGKLYGLAFASFVVLAMLAFFASIAGFAIMLAVNYFFDIELPAWSFAPIGVAFLACYMAVGNLFRSDT
jgi:hypothetical protein